MLSPAKTATNKAIREFLSEASEGRLAQLWTEAGPSETAVDYVENASPLPNGENILLTVAFAVWNTEDETLAEDFRQQLSTVGHYCDALSRPPPKEQTHTPPPVPGVVVPATLKALRAALDLQQALESLYVLEPELAIDVASIAVASATRIRGRLPGTGSGKG